MNTLKIKVCGMCDMDNIREIASLKPDLMGFIFHPGSPRFIGEPSENLNFGDLPSEISKTGVFVNAGFNNIQTQVNRFGLQIVQLHGNESPEMCKQLFEFGVQVIKVFNLSEKFNFSIMIPYLSCCNSFLFDTATKIHGGSGIRFDWGMLEKYQLGHPFYLSGGIDESDAEKILSISRSDLIGVDINSKFEIAPGIKDVEKVSRFINKIRA